MIKKRGPKFKAKKTIINGKEVKRHKEQKVEVIENELTPKENHFLWHYFTNGYNGTQAVLSAYKNITNEDTARNYASELIAKPHIKRKITEHLNMVAITKQVTPNRIIGEIASIALSDITDYVDVKDKPVFDGDDENDESTIKYRAVIIKRIEDMVNTRAVASIKQGKHGIEVKLWDKPKMLELLTQLLRMQLLPSQGDNDIDVTKLTEAELKEFLNLYNKARKDDEPKQLE